MTDLRDDGLPAPGEATLDGEHAVRVGVQSADRLRRELLAAHLDTLPEFAVVGRAARYEDIVSLSALERPAIVLLDAGQDIGETVAGSQMIHERCPEAGLAVTYENLTAPKVTALREAGVDALVPYAHGLAGVVEVLRKLAAGMPISTPPSAGLSGRQREVLLLLASGHNTAEIAQLLGISAGTVESHKRQVYAKLGVASALQAVARAVSYGIIDGERSVGVAAPAGVALPTPPAGWLPPWEDGRPLMAVATGGNREVLDRVVATLISQRVSVVRDHAPSWVEPMHGLRWHRGRVGRVLVDPAPEHWRVAAGAWRRTVVVRSSRYRLTARVTAANGGAALLQADHIEHHLVPVLMLVTQGYLVMDYDFSWDLEKAASIRSAGHDLRKPTLTGREYDILKAIGRSLTVRQTARRLGISAKTVENTQVHLFRKLNVHNRAEALAAAYSLGLLRPDGAT